MKFVALCLSSLAVLPILLILMGRSVSILYLWNDRPGLPFEPVVPLDPLIANHYFGDYLQPWHSVKAGLGEAYYGFYYAFFMIFSRLPAIFGLYVIISVGIILAGLKLTKLSATMTKLPGVNILLFVLVFNWPFWFAIDRGNIQFAINSVLGIAIYSELVDANVDLRSNPWFRFLTGALLSIKLYSTLIFIVLFLRKQGGHFSGFLKNVLIWAGLWTIAPALWDERGFLYVTTRGPSADQYNSLTYFKSMREWNYSIPSILSDIKILDASKIYSGSILILLLGNALIFILLKINRNAGNSTKIAFLLVVINCLGLPISSPYVLGLFSLPVLVFIHEGPNQPKSINGTLDYAAVGLSCAMIMPNLFKVPPVIPLSSSTFGPAVLAPLAVFISLLIILQMSMFRTRDEERRPN